MGLVPFPGREELGRLTEFSEHNWYLFMFGQTDAAEQEGVGFHPRILPRQPTDMSFVRCMQTALRSNFQFN